MEAFSLLKYWRTAGGGSFTGAATTTAADTSITAAKATTKTIAAAVSPYSSDGEDGPYFDLEFALPEHESESDTDGPVSTESQHENDVTRLQSEDDGDDDDETESEEISVHENDDEEEEAELKFSVNNNECTDLNAAVSPSDDLFFKGNLVTIEPSSILLNGAEDNSKLPVFLVKSASKFRVLMLKLKKSKSANGENPEKADNSEKPDGGGGTSSTPPKTVERENQGKMNGNFFVKLKVEEAPLANLYTRESSSKEKTPTKHSGVYDLETKLASDERKLSKEMMNKYLKMVKPFYIRVSKRYVDKLKFSGHSGGDGGGGGSKGCAAALSPESNVKNSQHKQGKNLQAGLKVVKKHLGKSRSASAAAAAPPGKAASDRRDDSLLQVQDGIQGAILHCKKSFNASRDVDSSSILCRSVSDPSMPKFSRASSSTTSGSEAKKRD